MEVGGIRFSDFTVIASDFASQFPVSCLGFTGILGLNYLKDLNLKLDLAGNVIHISDQPFDDEGYIATSFKYSALGGVAIKINFEFGDAWFVLDTGKNDAMQIGDNSVFPYLEDYKYESRKQRGSFSSSFQGVKENDEVTTYIIRNINIDNIFSIDSVPVDIDDSQMQLFGNELLKYFSIIEEIPNNKIKFKKVSDEKITEGFKDTFGLTPMWGSEDKLYISAITEQTLAYVAGLKIGDRIMSLNNQDTRHFDQGEYCSLIKKLSSNEESFDTKNELDITVIREDGKLRSYQLEK